MRTLGRVAAALAIALLLGMTGAYAWDNDDHGNRGFGWRSYGGGYGGYYGNAWGCDRGGWGRCDGDRDGGYGDRRGWGYDRGGWGGWGRDRDDRGRDWGRDRDHDRHEHHEHHDRD